VKSKVTSKKVSNDKQSGFFATDLSGYKDYNSDNIEAVDNNKPNTSNLLPFVTTFPSNKEMPKIEEFMFANNNRTMRVNSKAQNFENKTLKTKNAPKQAGDLDKKISNYRIVLNQELVKLLADERQKEEERESQLRNCGTEDVKERLERIFGVERAVASNRILAFNK
jgi:hypothetical protein